jgi:hypothetical protein
VDDRHPGDGPPAPGLAGLDLAALRALRRDAQREEADLSYLRRMLHGRIDILRAELRRRGARDEPPPCPPALVEHLSEILADEPSPVRSSARHVTLGIPLTEPVRRLAEDVLAEDVLFDLCSRPYAELDAVTTRLLAHEHHVSRRRHVLQQTIDSTSAEIARRYRDGEARVEDLLALGGCP